MTALFHLTILVHQVSLLGSLTCKQRISFVFFPIYVPLWDHPCGTYVKFFQHNVRVCIREYDVSFSEKFAYVLNERSLCKSVNNTSSLNLVSYFVVVL